MLQTVLKDNEEILLRDEFRSYPDTRQQIPAPNEKASRGGLTVVVVRDLDGLSHLRNRWDELVQLSDGHVFQTYEWLMAWWRHFGAYPDRSLYVLVIREGNANDSVGILPMFLETKRFMQFRIYKRLRFLGAGVASRYADGMFVQYGPSDFLDAIIHPQYRTRATAAIVEYLLQHPNIADEIEFVNVPEDSLLRKDLLPELENSGIPFKVKRTDVCPRLLRPTSALEYISSRNNNVQKNFLRYRKHSTEQRKYSLVNLATKNGLADALSELIILHQSRWRRLGYPGLFADPRFEQFLKDVIATFQKQGWIWCKKVEVEGKSIGVRICFDFNNRFYDYLSGFDDRAPWSKYRPGLALLFSLIDDAIEKRYTSVEFCRGNERYKFDLTDQYTTNFRVTVKTAGKTFSLRNIIYRLVTMVERYHHRLLYERFLIRVHREQYPFPLYVWQYVRFRMGGVYRKVSQRVKNVF